MENIAIIPARSGSKGLKDKNIKLLHGKPLLAYTIEAAVKSGIFSEIHVSTDSEKYGELAKEYGASVPFYRSRELAEDTTSTWEVVLYVLDQYKRLGKQFDTFAVLQPTSPIRDADDIRNAYELYSKKDAKSVVSVCEMEHSPLWANTLPKDGNLENFKAISCLTRRQELPTYYRLNGAIYISDIKYFKQYKNLYHDKGYAYVMNKERSIDIDNIYDFEYASFIIENYEKIKKFEEK